MSTSEDQVKGKLKGKDGQPRKRRKITRSREGCLTCRRRRKLCSMDKPLCEACGRLSLECKWPEAAPAEAGPSRTMTPVANAPLPAPPMESAWLGSNGYETVMDGLFEPNFQLDEATLQLWAVVTLSAPGPVDYMNLLQRAPSNGEIPIARIQPQHSSPIHVTQDPQRILEQFNSTLESLCVTSGPETRRNLEHLTSLAESSATSTPAKALHLSILAWAGLHLWSSGETQHDSPADKAGAEASKLLSELLAVFNADWPHTERMTLMAAVMMAINHKILKGDTWGFRIYLEQCAMIATTLYSPSDVPETDARRTYFYEHLLSLDALGTHTNLQRPLLDPAVVATYSKIAPDVVMTWTGLAFPLHSSIYRTAALVRHRRAIPLPTRPWTDQDLHEFLRAADELLREIGQSQGVMHAILKAKPHLKPHQHLHDAYRLAAQINVRTAVLCEAPSAMTVRLLVRQLLAVIEYMLGNDIPGITMLHWPLFQAAIASRLGGQASGLDDRERSLVLYRRFSGDKCRTSALNVSRSLQLVEELWSRTDGSAYVDWIDILVSHDWELFLM